MPLAAKLRCCNNAPDVGRRRWSFVVGMVGILAVTAWLVLASHRQLSATVDEPMHIVAGMEWLELGTYKLWPENPPLSRIGAAAGPFLAGDRMFPNGELDVPTALRLLYGGDNRLRTLALARRGILPLLLVSICLVGMLGSLWLNKTGGMVAAALFASLPPVLAHGGLATTDIPALTAFLAASLALLLWAFEASLTRSVVLGILLGGAIGTKFSLVGFLLAAGGSILLFRRVTYGALAAGWKRGLLFVVAGCFITTWAVYRFSHGAIVTADSTEALRDILGRCLDGGSLMRTLADRVVTWPLPFPDFFRGLLDLCAHNAAGHIAYVLGRTSRDGFWYYFPLALAVKTPVPFLVLVLIGITAGIKTTSRTERLAVLGLGLSALTMLGISMASRINIGIRHILPVYAPLALIAAYGARALWSANQTILRPLLAAFLVGSAVLIGPLAAPDFLPYFNVLAGRDPSEVLLDSDLDWGQDLFRLEAAVKERGIEELHVAYFGSNLLCDHGLPKKTHWLQPYQPTTGWIAISEMLLKGVIRYSAPADDFCDFSRFKGLDSGPAPYAWLDGHQPVQRVGKSIRLYYVP